MSKAEWNVQRDPAMVGVPDVPDRFRDVRPLFRDRDGKRWNVFAPPKFTGDTMFRAIVQIDPPKETTAGGLHKAETYQTPSTEGVVLDMSHGGYGLEIGTRVAIGRYAGIPLGDEFGDRLKIVNYEEIVLVQPVE